MRIVAGVFGILLALASAFFVVAAVSDLVTGGDAQTSRGVLAGLLLCFTGLAVAGVWLAKAMLARRATGPGPLQRERAVLALAAAAGGRVTVAEVALRCGLSVAESQAALDARCAQRVAELLITDRGEPVYAFAGLDPAAKRTAAELLGR
jgi:hypothetical protein